MSCQVLVLILLFAVNETALSQYEQLTSTDSLNHSQFNNKPDSAEEATYQETAFTSGMWVPRGHLGQLGPHPSFGVMFGHWKKQFLWEIAMDARFGRSANRYTVIDPQGYLATTTNYSGVYAGIHFGYAFLNSKYSTLYALTGFGLDNFTAISDTQDKKGVTLSTINLNAGLGFKHFGKKGGLIGLELLQNFTFYENPKGSSMDGSAITVRLILGLTE